MSRTMMYVGCYTHESPVGIRVWDASRPDGRLVETAEVTGLEHPSFLAVHPRGRVLYAVSETATFDETEGGGILALSIDPADGSLTLLDRAPSCGVAPCYLSLDADGRYAYVANYGSGTVAVHALGPDGRFDGLLAVERLEGAGPHPRQDGPHAHCVVPAPEGDSVYAVDLGTDAIVRYEHVQSSAGASFERRETLVLDAGSGPRHLAFHPEWPIAFVVGELDSTLHVLGVDAAGPLHRLGSYSTVPDEFDGDSLGAEVRVHPRGDRVYVSNRGHDSLAVFACDGPDAPLRLLGHVDSGGRTPRNFGLHPSGRHLVVANQDGHNLVLFELDPSTELPRRDDVDHSASEPVVVLFAEIPG